MIRDLIEDKWNQIGVRVREQWGRLTDDPQREFAGRRDQFADRIRKRYGISKQEAELMAENFISRNRKWWDLSNR